MYEVRVRNNDEGSCYIIQMSLSGAEVHMVERLGMRLTEESDWSLTMTVMPVSVTGGFPA